MLTLPRAYLSYSAASLWYQNKSQFRSNYYTPSGIRTSSPQTDYGKEIADMLKDDPTNPIVAHIPSYEIKDVGFTVDISGVPVLMYPDSLSLIGTPKFYEFKTGVDPWTQEKVDDHMQLKLYSLGIKIKYGSVQDECTLFWLPTKMEDEIQETKINGKVYKVAFQVPKMTGEVIPFPCVITEVERYRAREWIVQAASEISADYQRYLKSNGHEKSRADGR